jgi:two-component sensor histidine kinase
VLREYSPVLSDAYAQRGDLTKAWHYDKLADSLRAATDNTQQTLDDAAKLARLNLQQHIETSRLDKEAGERSGRAQQTLLVVSLLALIILTALLLYIYHNLRVKSRNTAVIAQQAAHLQQQNKIIDEALKEKEVLLQETHHRVKNNLQLINSLMELQLSEARSNGAPSDLRAMQQRVHSIAMVHGRLLGTHDSGTVEFRGFVKDLFAGLSTAFSDGAKPVQFIPGIPAVSFGIDTLVPLGLILNELMTNSYKHAFRDVAQGMVRVDLQEGPEGYVLRYYDNGPGLRPGQFEEEGHSLGLYLIRRLSKQLKGRADYTFSDGSIFTISFRHERH